MPKLIIISAPSGAGKTTLCQKLLQEFPQLVLSISTTTRAPRGKETNGKEYFFITPKEFEERIKSDSFAEWAKVHGNYYGTSKEVIEKAFAAGRSVLLDIDVQGAKNLTKSYPPCVPPCVQGCFKIFITTPSLAELEKRLRARGTDNEETILRRLTNAKTELAQIGEFDRTIINDSFDKAYEELKAIIIGEGLIN